MRRTAFQRGKRRAYLEIRRMIEEAMEAKSGCTKPKCGLCVGSHRACEWILGRLTALRP